VGEPVDSKVEVLTGEPAGATDREGFGVASPAPDGREQAGPEENAPSADARHSALAAYRQQVYSLIAANKRYPSIARRLRHEGRVALAFTLDRKGNLMSANVKARSGYAELDEAALAAVRAVGKFPGFPASVESAELDFEVTLVFELE